jgi:peptidoglycan/xylan/chitin deacetylase (PgdA/CDA1 family)
LYKKKLKKPLLLITFDDGHKSNYEVAEEILKQHNIKAIFFIPYNYINYHWPKNIKNQSKISNNKFNVPCNIYNEIEDKRTSVSMSWANIKKLHNNGHTIGCHGMNHVRLSSKLTKIQLYDEILNSKQFLEKKLNTKIETFCWIGGERWAYCRSAHSIIKKAKYKYSFTTCADPLNPQKFDNLKIHRFNIETSFTKNQTRATLTYFYSLIYILKRKYVNKILDK